MLLTLLCLLLVVCFLGIWGLIHFLEPNAKPHTARVHKGKFPQPRLQSVPYRDVVNDKAAQEKELNSYGWSDRGRTLSHIPIGKAMELLLTRGLPEVGAGQTRTQIMQARATEAVPRQSPAASSQGPNP